MTNTICFLRVFSIYLTFGSMFSPAFLPLSVDTVYCMFASSPPPFLSPDWEKKQKSSNKTLRSFARFSVLFFSHAMLIRKSVKKCARHAGCTDDLQQGFSGGMAPDV
jgi:hypothetical protein